MGILRIKCFVFIILLPYALFSGAVREDEHYFEWTGEGEFSGMYAVAWIPDPSVVTRGFFLRPCHGRPPGSDNRFWARAPLDTIDGIAGEGAMTKRLARAYDFGVIGLAHFPGDEHWQEGGDAGRSKQGRSTRAVIRMLEEFSELGFPEFLHAPMLSFGGSHAGVASWSLACAIPDRMIAVAPNDPMACIPGIMPESAFEVPVFFSQGNLANGEDGKDERSLLESRRFGARTSFVNVEQMGHEDGPTFDLVFPLLEASILLRMPADANPQTGQVDLKSIPLTDGWLADSDFRSGLVEISSYNLYPKSKVDAYWFPEKSLAHTFRGIASYGSYHVLHAEVGDGRRLGMTRAHILLEADRPVANDAKAFDALARPGQTLTLTVEEKRGDPSPVKDWNRIEFFRDGSTIGEITSGQPMLTIELERGSRLFQTYTAIVYHNDETAQATRYGATLAVEEKEPSPLLPRVKRTPLAPVIPLYFNGLQLSEVGVSSANVSINLTSVSGPPPQKPVSSDTSEAVLPGANGEVRLVYWSENEASAERTEWVQMESENAYSHQFSIEGLRAKREYQIRAEARNGPGHPITAIFETEFRTATRPAR